MPASSQVMWTMPFAGRVLAAEDNTPLPNATVHIVRDGQAIGVTADNEGLYYFNEAVPGEVVQVRFVGRATETFAVPREPRQFYTHTLAPSGALDEVEIFGDKPTPGGEGEAGNGLLWGLAALTLGLAIATRKPKPRRK